MTKEKKKEFIPLHNDLMFKGIFGENKNKRFTIFLLESVPRLPSGSLKNSTISNSIVISKDVVQNKTFSLDVIAKTASGARYVLEMQLIYDKNAEIKNFMYMARLFGLQLSVGDVYRDVKPVILINFVKVNKVHKTKKLITPYFYTSKYEHTDKAIEDLSAMYTVDISKKIRYNRGNERLKEIIALIGAETLEEAKRINDNSNNKIIKDLYKEMVRFMDLEYVQDYSLQDKLIRSRIYDAKEEGITKGITKGIAKGKAEGKAESQLEIAKNFLKTDISIEIISKNTGLSISKLKELKKELN